MKKPTQPKPGIGRPGDPVIRIPTQPKPGIGRPGDPVIRIPTQPKPGIGRRKPSARPRPMLPGYVYPMADTSGSNLADYKKNRNIKKK